MDQLQRDQVPQRLSALYQYHNAPEVAPAHGLEYDDSNYPSSDKYPVISSSPFEAKYTGKHAYNDNRPPRIIFGMKVRTFLLVAFVMALIIVGAAVGGAVGGKSMHENQPVPVDNWVSSNATSSSATPTPSASATATSASSYTAPTPTYTPIRDCPQSNNTLYTSSFASGRSGTVPASARLNFTRYCDVTSPLTGSNAMVQSEAYVYSFGDCVEVCASLNFWAGNAGCSVAVYESTGGRPGNCWVGSTNATVRVSSLVAKDGTDVALLNSGDS